MKSLVPAALVLLIACGDELGPRVPAAIVVTPESPRVPWTGTLQLDAVVVDAAGREIQGHAIAFVSSADSVMTVSEGGLLASVGPDGGSRITAMSGDISAEVTAEVALPPSTVVLSRPSMALGVGEERELRVIVTDANGEPMPAAAFAVESSDPAVVQVSTYDLEPGSVFVYGIRMGSASVAVTSGGASRSVPVTVERHPRDVILTPGSLVLTAGASQQVSAVLVDQVGQEMDPLQPFTWSSSDEDVATVSSTGLVTSAGPEGSAIITATTDTFSASVGVFIGTAPAGERLARQPLLFAEGVAVSPSGQYFASGWDFFVRGELPDFTFSTQIPVTGSPGFDVVVNASVTRAYLIGAGTFLDGIFAEGVVVMDLTTNTEVDFIDNGLGGALSGVLSGDESVLALGTRNGVEIIDLASKASLGGTALGPMYKITRHPSKPLLYASGETGVFELDHKTGEVVRRFGGTAYGHIVSNDGNLLYTVNFDEVGVWNLETGLKERGYRAARGTEIAITPDDRFLYVVYGDDHVVGGSRVFIVDAKSGARVREVILGGVSERIGMSADGIAVISNDNSPGWVDFVR